MARLEMDLTEGGAIASAQITAQTLFQMGLDSATGRSGDVDHVTAHKWFNIAAARGVEAAAEYRQELAAEMSADEIRTAQREAREWMRLH